MSNREDEVTFKDPNDEDGAKGKQVGALTSKVDPYYVIFRQRELDKDERKEQEEAKKQKKMIYMFFLSIGLS